MTICTWYGVSSHLFLLLRVQHTGISDCKLRTDLTESSIKQRLLEVSSKAPFPCTGLWKEMFTSWHPEQTAERSCKEKCSTGNRASSVHLYLARAEFIATSFCLYSAVSSSLLLKPHQIFQKPLELTNCQISSIPSSHQSVTSTVIALMRNLESFKTGICPMGKIQSNHSIQEKNILA